MIKHKKKHSFISYFILVIVLLVGLVSIYEFGFTMIHFIISVGIGIFIFKNRYDIAPYLAVNRPRLSSKEETEISENEEWFDDYYTIKYIDEKTIAIGEPRYWQRNYNYLVIGDEKAVLFDSGPGVRDITKVVKALTDLPVINMISHYHYDHVGCIDQFDDVYLATNQLQRQQLTNNSEVIPNKKSFLGSIEGIQAKSFKVTRLVENKELIDLGNRTLKVLEAPGHDCESIVLYDEKANQLFAGDYLLKGPIYASPLMMPSSSLIDYKYSMELIYNQIKEGVNIYLAHPLAHEDQVMSYEDIKALHQFFQSKKKNNLIPKKKQINEHVSVIY